MVSVSESDQLQGKVGDEHKGCGCPETKSDVVEVCQVIRVSLVLKEVPGEEADENDHTQSSGNG